MFKFGGECLRPLVPIVPLVPNMPTRAYKKAPSSPVRAIRGSRTHVSKVCVSLASSARQARWQKPSAPHGEDGYRLYANACMSNVQYCGGSLAAPPAVAHAPRPRKFKTIENAMFADFSVPRGGIEPPFPYVPRLSRGQWAKHPLPSLLPSVRWPGAKPVACALRRIAAAWGEVGNK